MPRDFQKSKVYNAEEQILWGRHLSWQETQDYIADITRTRFWKSLGGKEIKVKDGRGTTIARGNYLRKFVSLPKWARTELVILHELAHTITPPRYCSHGVTYIRNYLKLVRRFMGDHTWKELKARFKTNKVRTRTTKERFL
jgi:putative metallohydrolase (TIGR04338 family)